MPSTATAKASTATIAKAAGISPRTKRFVLRDEYGTPYAGARHDLVLAALSRSDITPDLPSRIHTVAYALRKCMVSGRMNAVSEMRIAAYSAYQLCALVARIANECDEETIGGICDTWLVRHHAGL